MFYLKNFKNFEEAKLSFDEPITLLVGPNGAGKSNLIEAVELLCFVANGRPLHEITDLGREGGLEVRGGLDACARRGERDFLLGYHGTVVTTQGNCRIRYEITIRVGKEPRVGAEVLYIEGRDIPVFEVLPSEADSPSADNAVRYDNYSRGMNKPTAAAAADRSALSQYARFARNNKKLAETLELIDAVTQSLAPPSVFDPIPKLMRGYERETETRLARNGFNISPVLAELLRKRAVLMKGEGKKTKVKLIDRSDVAERILARIAQLPDEPFKSFDFIRTKARDIMFGFRIQAGEKPVTARVLSDGTLRALAVLAALETSPRGQRIIVEEFDNGVHPSRVQVLTEALFDCSTKNGLRSLVTTHNPATLNALTPEQIGSVLLVANAPEQHGGRLIPLPELPGYIEFIEKGRLGDLITRRLYEQHLTGKYEENRKVEIEEWLATLP